MENTAKIQQVRGKPFPKGVSGNPKGKPKGTVHLSTILQKSLQNGSGYAIVNKVVEMAKSGNIKAIELVWSRIEGKPAQAMGITTNGEQIIPNTESIAIANQAISEFLEKVEFTYGDKK